MRKSFTVSMIAFIFQRLGAEEEVRQGDRPVLLQTVFPAPSQPPSPPGYIGSPRTTIYLRVHRKAAPSAPTHLTPSFRSDYRDESSTTWLASDPAGG